MIQKTPPLRHMHPSLSSVPCTFSCSWHFIFHLVQAKGLACVGQGCFWRGHLPPPLPLVMVWWWLGLTWINDEAGHDMSSQDRRFGNCMVHERKRIPPLRAWGGLGWFLRVTGHWSVKCQAGNKHLVGIRFMRLARSFVVSSLPGSGRLCGDPLWKMHSKETSRF